LWEEVSFNTWSQFTGNPYTFFARFIDFLSVPGKRFLDRGFGLRRKRGRVSAARFQRRAGAGIVRRFREAVDTLQVLLRSGVTQAVSQPPRNPVTDDPWIGRCYTRDLTDFVDRGGCVWAGDGFLKIIPK
jgi:hypothetical protein